MNATISGKTVVITGASSGMSAAAARHLPDHRERHRCRLAVDRLVQLVPPAT
jgi:NAD(P)-dependent dehydrogenase (short-subunit alcohol dehydrogenase family)